MRPRRVGGGKAGKRPRQYAGVDGRFVLQYGPRSMGVHGSEAAHLIN